MPLVDMLALKGRSLEARLQDRRLGIETCLYLPRGELFDSDQTGVDVTNAQPHSPIAYRMLRWLLDRIGNVEGRVLLDFGSGAGRAVLYAARRPFRRVIGVELSARLHRLAERNAARARGLTCPVELHETDAAAFPIPPEVDVFFFFNPFRGETLRRVVDNVEASLRERPRRAAILFLNPEHFEPLRTERPWIEPVAERSFLALANGVRMKACLFRCAAASFSARQKALANGLPEGTAST